MVVRQRGEKWFMPFQCMGFGCFGLIGKNQVNKHEPKREGHVYIATGLNQPPSATV